MSATTVEIFHQGARVASHLRSHEAGKHSTQSEHMPLAHQRYLDWTPSRIVHWAQKSGAATAEVVGKILASRTHPQQSFRSCLGVLRLGKSYSPERLEAACQRALRLGTYSYKAIAAILKNGLDQRALANPQRTELLEHSNIRGPQYYQDPPTKTAEK